MSEELPDYEYEPDQNENEEFKGAGAKDNAAKYESFSFTIILPRGRRKLTNQLLQ